MLLLEKFLSRRFKIKTSNIGSYCFLKFPHYIIGHKYIKFKSFTSQPGLRIECIDTYYNQKFYPRLNIGKGVSFNYRCHIGVINEVIIGDDVLIGSNVLITDHSHGTNSIEDIDEAPETRKLYSSGRVVIEEKVWIGENVCVLPNVTIGCNSIIGANSVVTHDIPPYSVAVGCPARVIRTIK